MKGNPLDALQRIQKLYGCFSAVEKKNSQHLVKLGDPHNHKCSYFRFRPLSQSSLLKRLLKFFPLTFMAEHPTNSITRADKIAK